MRVLGLGTEGDSGAAVVEDGRILAAVNEERLSRLKLVEGFPRGSIQEVLRRTGTSIADLDAVLVASTNDLFVNELRPFDGWFQHRIDGVGTYLKRATGKFARYRDQLPFLETGYYALLTPSFLYRRWAIRRILRNEFGVRCPIRFVDHHLAHIASAYFTSGYDDALVLSVDGGGDGKSALVYAVRHGRFERLHEVSSYNSLGNYYAYVTHLCGFKAMKHEGKITGLAAHGEPRYVDLLREFIDEQDGTFINKGKVAAFEALRELERRLPRGWTREDLAASIQRHTEDVVRRFVRYWASRTGLRNLALAGGVFANVRVNEEVLNLPEVDRVFIHPHMGDGGLPVGAALAACIPGILDQTMPRDPEPLVDVYLGPDLTEGDIAEALSRAGLVPESVDGPIEERIADLLVEGYVVARASGRMEYGPRALGNRSILYHPTDRTVNDWLNKNLRRTEFMPFAPSVLAEAADDCFENLEGGEHAAEFMTITFHCTPWMRARMEGVVHLDGTARPQLVRRDRNPSYYRIIEAFYRRTGLPGVINTSFNMHEEPIVCTAADCVRAFLDGYLDYLAIGPYLVKHPRGVTHALRPVERAREYLSI
ncbi:MAG: carbamoyltransferase C-terminal domain-containing protein [bacterium]|nr:MAG: carbamoyltransferase [bacterium]